MINKDLEYIAYHYGKFHQLEKCKEELNELIEAIDSKDDESIIEELADVEIMIDQVKHLMCASKLVELYRSYKISRQLTRIAKELSNEHDN